MTVTNSLLVGYNVYHMESHFVSFTNAEDHYTWKYKKYDLLCIYLTMIMYIHQVWQHHNDIKLGGQIDV